MAFAGAAIPKVCLAPMAGVTDPPFRAEAWLLGCNYSVSEIIASDQLARARPDMMRRAAGGEAISPLVIQLAGRDPHWMARGAQLAEAAGADVIDINMGCPRKVVTGCASGSALMRDLDLAERLIGTVVAHSNRPVTLKMRLGWDVDTMNAPALAERAQRAGVAMITVHGRTRSQFFNGVADWRAIRDTVEAVNVPVIANGDITNASDARTALAQSCAAGVMIGRAAQGRAWLVGAIERALTDGGEICAPKRSEVLESLLRLYRRILDFYGERLGLRIARKHLAWAIDAEFPGEADMRAARKRICTMERPADVERALQALFVETANRADWSVAA